MKKPNFIIVGFPKCGTTSLHHYLEEHPEIFMPEQKELHFFTSKKLQSLNNGPGDKIVKKTQISSEEKYLSFFDKVENEIQLLFDPPYELEDDAGWIVDQEVKFLGCPITLSRVDLADTSMAFEASRPIASSI